MTLEELGAALRAEREKRGLSIEDVANHLKIGARLLRALEEGDASSLPHLAYTKGFIRSYSSYLGLAAEEVSEAVKSLDSPEAEAAPQAVYTPDAALAPRGSFKWLGVLIVAALVAGGFYVAWQQGAFEFLGNQTRRLAQPSPPLQTPDSAESPQSPTDAEPMDSRSILTPAEQDAPRPSSEAVPAPTVLPQSAAAAGTSGASALNRQADAPQTRLAAAGREAVDATPDASRTTAREASSAAPVTETEGALPPGQHKVIITATEECWVHSNADNTDTRQFSLRKGDTFALTFANSLELKLGNAGGVRIRYNGEEMPAPGQSGQVRTLTFPPAAR